MKKFLMLILLVLCASVCLVACGDDDDDDSSSSKKKKKADADVTESVTEEVTPTPDADVVTIASTETWGDYTVGVPADWTFKKGDFMDEEDTRYCSVKKSDFKYFDFKMETEDLAKQHYDYNKNTYTNEQEDVSGTYGDIAWTGFRPSRRCTGSRSRRCRRRYRIHPPARWCRYSCCNRNAAWQDPQSPS